MATKAYRDACAVEAQSRALLEGFFRSIALRGQFVWTHGAVEVQKHTGDVLFNLPNSPLVCSAEIKAEPADQHGNLYLETWSNRKRFVPGWLYTSRADFLMYHFIETGALYVARFDTLRAWAFGHNGTRPRLFDFPEKPQRKHVQQNETWGVCVPIDVLTAEISLKRRSAPRPGEA